MRLPLRVVTSLLLLVTCSCGRGGCTPLTPATGAAPAPGSTALRAAGPAAVANPLRAPAAEEGRVIQVRDGDSIVVLRGGARVEVRLDGIDCPELGQPFGSRAKRFTADLALGRPVRLDRRGQDRYGRELAEVFLPDGHSLNRELVSAGLAWWFRRYSNDPDLEARERRARANPSGLWADPNPTPPWEFREAQRTGPGGRR